MSPEESDKVHLRDIYCSHCRKTTPHDIVLREVGCKRGEIAEIGICIYCNGVVFLRFEKRVGKDELHC